MSNNVVLSRRALLGGIAVSLGSAAIDQTAVAKTPTDHRLVAEPGQLGIAQTPQGDLKLPVWGYSGKVPGPLLRFQQGDSANIFLLNRLSEATSIHWHGLRLPNNMDGVPGLTQSDVAPGSEFKYVLPFKDAGTYWYHTHSRAWNQQDRGLYGVIVVDEKEPPKVDRDIILVIDDWLIDRQGKFDERRLGNMHDWAHAGRLGNLVTVNSEFRPNILIGRGERVRLRLVNVANSNIFGLKFEGHDPWIIAEDGDPVSPRKADGGVVILGPGQRADVVIDGNAKSDLHKIVARSMTGQSVLASLKYVAARNPLKGLAGTQVTKLAANPRPILDLTNARRLTLNMEGGAMGGLRQAKLNGKMRSWMELASKSRVWAFNGIAGDMAEPMATLKRGETVILKIQNNTGWPHAMHLHGMHFQEIKRNGSSVGNRSWRDSVLLNRRETVEVAFVAEEAGKWMLHCHMIEHQAGGMMTWLDIK